jgi:hypothetical protein
MYYKPTRVYYGRRMLIKKYCPRCKFVSIVADGKCTECGADQKLDTISKFRKKRESDTPLKRDHPTASTRRNALELQGNQCLYCGIHFEKGVGIHWDHFIPFVTGEGGGDNWVAACAKCNVLKSCYMFNSVEEAQLFIRNRRTEKGLPNYDYHGGSYLVSKL